MQLGRTTGACYGSLKSPDNFHSQRVDTNQPRCRTPLQPVEVIQVESQAAERGKLYIRDLSSGVLLNDDITCIPKAGLARASPLQESPRITAGNYRSTQISRQESPREEPSVRLFSNMFGWFCRRNILISREDSEFQSDFEGRLKMDERLRHTNN